MGALQSKPARWCIGRSVLTLSLIILLALVNTAQAGFEEGEKAYRNGNFAAALKEWIPLAKKGNDKAEYYLGRMYQNGQGVEMDSTKAAKWYNSAATKGNVHAQYELGMIFHRMAMTEFDYQNALKFITKAAIRGHLKALYTLGKMYRDGYGVEVDPVRAYVMFGFARKRLKEARAAFKQLEERMSNQEVALAKKLGKRVFDPSVKTSVEGSSIGPKGICSLAKNNLVNASISLSIAAQDLEDCLGEQWAGELCQREQEMIEKAYENIRITSKVMNSSC